MKDIKLLLQSIISFFSRRGIGHTWAALNGVQNQAQFFPAKAKLIARNASAVRLHHGIHDKGMIIDIDDFYLALRGIQCPVVFDHSVVEYLAEASLRHIQALELAGQIAGLEAYRRGFLAAMQAFAWWKEGTQYVGTSGKTLTAAIDEIESNSFYGTKAARLAIVNEAIRKAMMP